jgi:hypothetical protein
LLPVPSFVVFRALIDVVLTILELAIDQAGQAMGHGSDGFRGNDNVNFVRNGPPSAFQFIGFRERDALTCVASNVFASTILSRGPNEIPA